MTVFHLFHFVLIPYKEKERVSRSFFFVSNGTRFAGLPFEILALHRLGRGLVGRREGGALRPPHGVFAVAKLQQKQLRYFVYSLKGARYLAPF